MKPRLRFVNGAWSCFSDTMVRWGRTPADAFTCWRVACEIGALRA